MIATHVTRETSYMYFAVSKLVFDLDSATGQDEKQLKSLCEKIRARFKVAAASHYDPSKGETCIVIAALASNDEKLSQQLDSISALCEESGFGRIEDELTLLDHVDTIEEGIPDSD